MIPPAIAQEPDHRIAELEAEIAKLRKINAVLMDRVERSTDLQGNAFSLFETAITLESKVRERTSDLERALDELATANTELASAKEAADEAQRRLRDAIESINEGFAIFDGEDRLVLYNQTYLSLWPSVAARIRPGMRFDEIAELIREDGEALGSLVAPDRWLSERMAQHAVAAGGHVHALADGRWIQINELRTSEGGIVGVYTDITQVKADDARERARELAEKSAMLQATLDNISHGVCVYDAARKLVAWNDPLPALLGLPADVMAAIGEHKGLVAQFGKAVDWVAARRGRDAIVGRLSVSDRILEVRRSAMPGGGMVLSFSDVTESLRAADAMREANETLERRVEERTAAIAAVNSQLQQQIADRIAAEQAMREAKTVAEQANISKTRFLAAASHDLLQPLNAARLFVAALADRRLAAGTQTLVQQTSSALDSVEDLLEALLEISKLDAGAIVPQIDDFPLDDLFRSMKAEFSAIARERGLDLVIPDSSHWVRSDQRLLRRIVQNFLSNALRYTQKGWVAVQVHAIGAELRIEVTDTGPGIAPEQHGIIFEEFRRLDQQPGDHGMGLGLAIVQRASRMLGHRVDLHSELGAGSTFSIAVPLGAEKRRMPAMGTPTRAGALADRAILVLDNEPAILEGMAELLGGWGCQVRTAVDEVTARAAIGTSPDIIIADYHLDHGVHGDEVVGRLRAAIGHDVPAIIITADREPDLRERLIGEGFHLLTKPVKPAQLRALLSRLTG